MQRDHGRFAEALRFGLPFGRKEGGWEFFYRDLFSMFLRWTQPIILVDGTPSRDTRLMRRKVMGKWQYRALDERELRYILAVENGTHC